jgi:hypothetical protein
MESGLLQNMIFLKCPLQRILLAPEAQDTSILLVSSAVEIRQYGFIFTVQSIDWMAHIYRQVP